MEPGIRRLLVALTGALAVALFIIAFLLGRMSAKTDPPAITATLATQGAAPASTISEASPESPSPSPIPLEPFAPIPGAVPTTTATPTETFQIPTPQAPNASPSPSQERQQIAAYFAQVERVGDMGPGDPQAFASSLMDSVTSGDFSSFDDLLSKSRSQRDRLRAITPPSRCAEYHRLALTLSNDSVTLLEKLKAALMKGDTTALMAMTIEGRTLEAQANQLKSLGDVLKRPGF